jgi:hypothetical protein
MTSCRHPLLLLHDAIELERLGQPLARFVGVRRALKHYVLHAEFRVAAYCRCDLLRRAGQGIVEEDRFLGLEIGESEADERRDVKRRRIAPDLAACGLDSGEWLGHCLRFAHIASVPEVGVLPGGRQRGQLLSRGQARNGGHNWQ